MYLAVDLSAFKTPKGVQLNLYLNLLGISGKPPHILVKFSDDKSSFFVVFLKSLINLEAKIWSIPGSSPASHIKTFLFVTKSFSKIAYLES